MKEIRKLKAHEIEMRIGTVAKSGGTASILLYQDSRCGMTLLDENFGVGGWQSSYEKIDGVLYCKIGVWGGYIPRDVGKVAEHWIWKQSNGIESKGTGDTDPNNVKGEASDAFKRACVMWGIGRELYEWKGIRIDYDSVKDKYAKFTIKEIAYTDKGEPKDLVITKYANYKDTIVYTMKNGNYRKSNSKSVEKPNASNHIENKENANTEKPNSVKIDLEPTKDVANTIRKTNIKIWGEIITKIKEVAFDCDVEKENLDGHLEDEPYNYFVNELKLKTSNGKLVGVEFMKQDSKPLVANNIVTVVDDDFYVAFAEYLKAKVFLPF